MKTKRFVGPKNIGAQTVGAKDTQFFVENQGTVDVSQLQSWSQQFAYCY
jgi:hypothetical protein